MRLWAIDLAWLQNRSVELLKQYDATCPGGSEFTATSDYLNRILLRDENPYVIVSASPARLNQRMLVQQGHLLCNLRRDIGFSTILLGMLIHPSIVDRQVISKVKIKTTERIRFLTELHRMNIHEASLFPGLDGFARSLATSVAIAVGRQIELRRQEMIENVFDYRRQHETERLQQAIQDRET